MGCGETAYSQHMEVQLLLDQAVTSHLRQEFTKNVAQGLTQNGVIPTNTVANWITVDGVIAIQLHVVSLYCTLHN